MNKSILGVVASMSLTVCAAGVASVASAATPSYVVERGNTLYGIATHYHVSVSSLEAANHLHSSVIYPGQRLVLPVTQTKSTSHTSQSSSSSTRTITVKSGDTLWGLSRTYGVSVTNLEQWNHLSNSSVLKVGQRLVLHPTQGYASTTPSSSQPADRSMSFTGSTSSAATLSTVANDARHYIGVPYLWGGESPSGFDCSGLVQYVYREAGVSIPRTSYDQYDAATPVSEANLTPGMLVFFDCGGPGASHVGIYLGNGQFISATSHGVMISDLTSGYWAGYFIGGRNIL